MSLSMASLLRGVPRTLLTMFALCGCGETEISPASLVLTVGQESDAWDRDPAPTRIVVTARTSSGDQPLLDAPWPVDKLDMGELIPSTAYAFSAVLRDGNGNVIMRGGTPFILSDLMSGGRLPLFCGRAGELARPTSGLHDGVKNPALALLNGRFVLAVDPQNGASQFYDFGFLAPVTTDEALPLVPATIATSDGVSLLLLSASGAAKVDTLTGGAADPGITFSQEVIGGRVIHGEDGTAFVVGPTRAKGESTSAVLKMLPDGTITRVDITTPTIGAAAAWIPGSGLLVVGGQGRQTAELLPVEGSNFVSVSTSLPAVIGGAVYAPRKGEAIVAGGVDAGGVASPTLRLKLSSCGEGCEAVTTAGSALGIDRAEAFSVADGKALFVGQSADGATSVALVSDDGLSAVTSSVALRQPRRDAAAIAVGDGYVALLGGTTLDGQPALDVELFMPP